jgi:opacity protein-like surface antigen
VAIVRWGRFLQVIFEQEDLLRTFHVFALTLLLSGVATLPARADGFVTPFVGYNFGGDSKCPTINVQGCEDRHSNFGVSFGKMGTVFGFEEDIAFAKDFFGTVPGADSSVFTAMSNLLVGVGAGPIQPYFVVGLGVIRPHTSLTLANSDFDKYALGYDIGGGLSGFFSKHVGVRGDLRYMHTAQDVPILSSVTTPFAVNQKLDFWRASIGLVLR